MTDSRPADPTNALSTGDALAEAGDWTAAVEAWQRAATDAPSLRPAVAHRLEWLLDETGISGSAKGILPLAATFVVASALSMAFLMLAGEPGSLGADIWAAAAWAAIAVAIIAALLAARRWGEAPLPRLLASARRTAKRLDRESVTGETS